MTHNHLHSNPKQEEHSPLRIDGGLRTQGIVKQRGIESPPLISIVTVCLNASKTIAKCIESVLSQTYPRVEFIIVDGVSNDETLEIIKKYDNSIDYFISEPDDGVYDALNKGVSLANGDYIMLLHAYSCYSKDCLSELVHARNEKQADLVSARLHYVDESGVFKSVSPKQQWDESALFQNPLRLETMLVPAEVYEKFGAFDLNYQAIADDQFVIKLYEAGLTHSLLDKPVMESRCPNAKSAVYFDERRQALKAQFPYVNPTEIEKLVDLDALTKEDVLNVLWRNKIYHKFHASLLVFSKSKWVFGEQFLLENNTVDFQKSHLRIELFAHWTKDQVDSKWLFEPLTSLGLDVGYNEVSNSRTTPTKLVDIITIINRADVLHFHNDYALLDYGNFDLLADKAIVLTLDDASFFDEYHSNDDDVWVAKKEAYARLDNLTVVCSSQRIAEKAKNSKEFSLRNVKVIYNPVQLSSFYPENKMVARIKLGLELNKRYVLLQPGNSIKNSRNFDIATKSLSSLNGYNRNDFQVITVGMLDELEGQFSKHNMDFNLTDDKLRLIYSAADVFAITEPELISTDTVAEVMACGTPIVSFQTESYSEFIVQNKNGYIAPSNNTSFFAEGLALFLTSEINNRMSSSFDAANSIRKRNNPLASSLRYQSLYTNMAFK